MSRGGARPRPNVVLALWFGWLPLFGLLAGMLDGIAPYLGLFPTAAHLLLCATAVVANFALHLGAFRSPRALPVRAALLGYVAGAALTYAWWLLPMLPLIGFLFVTGIGFLAAAPYWALVGAFVLAPDLVRRWRAQHGLACLALLMTPAFAVFPAFAALRGWPRLAPGGQYTDAAEPVRRIFFDPSLGPVAALLVFVTCTVSVTLWFLRASGFRGSRRRPSRGSRRVRAA